MELCQKEKIPIIGIDVLTNENDFYELSFDIWCYQSVSSKVDFHQSGIEKGTRERVRSKVAKFGYHYKFLSSF